LDDFGFMRDPANAQKGPERGQQRDDAAQQQRRDVLVTRPGRTLPELDHRRIPGLATAARRLPSVISQFRRKDDRACLRRHQGLRPRRTLRGSPAAGPRRAAGRAEAPPATCQARITAAAAAGRRAGRNLRPCGSRLVSAGSHLFWEVWRMSKAKEIMHWGAECVAASDTLETAARMMRDGDVGSLPICGPDNRLQGIITDRDIVVKCLAEGRDPKTTTAGDLAQGKPVWVDADADDSEVLRLMEEHQIRRLPVIEERRL